MRRGKGGFDLYLKLILLIGLFAFVIKCHIVYPIEYVGHADASGYAEMADSIVHGRGLEVDYISFHFLKYDEEIERPEEHWPPLYSFFIVPFFLLFGKTAFAAKLPSLIISCFLFPLVGYLLGRRLTENKLVGLAAGLNILFYPVFFRHSLYCLSDITFAFMVCLTVFLAIKGIDDERFFYPMGVCIGLSYYAKGSGLVLIPAYVLFYLFFRFNQNLHSDREFLIGMLLCFLTMLPWFVRNTIHFHNPIFSTQQFAAGYIGYIGWEEGTYKLYWGENLPAFGDKFKQGFRFVYDNTWKFLKQYLWWTFIDLRRKTSDFNAKDYYTYFTGIPAAVVLGMSIIATVYRIQINLARRIISNLEQRKKVKTAQGRLLNPPFSLTFKKSLNFLLSIHHDIWKILKPWHNNRLHLITFVGVFLFGFLSLCWNPINRMAFPLSGLVIVVGWVSYYTFLRSLLRNLNYSKTMASFLVFLLFTVIAIHSVNKVEYDYKNSGYPYHEGGQDWIEAGRWIRKNLPGSVTMTRNPWELHFYSEEKAIQIPLAPLEDIVKVAKYYGATHLIPEDRRPTLKPWINGEVPGLKLVYDRGIKIYKIESYSISNKE